MKTIFLTLTVFLGTLAFADIPPATKVGMICEPRPGHEYPTEILSPEVTLLGEGAKRYLNLTFRGNPHTVELEALSMREFMGQLKEYTVFFELEGQNFVKILLTFTNFETMESIGPLKLNCYTN